MIKTTTARAMQISTMEKWQIEQLHELEAKRGYILPNWNIQALFHMDTVKDIYGLRDDDLEGQAAYNDNIDKEIERVGIKQMIEGAETGNEWFHAFDWAVLAKRAEISWDYAQNKKGGILSRLAKAVPLILLALEINKK